MAILVTPIQYFPDPTKGRPVFNGSIYVGVVDLDPKTPGNQVQLSVVEADGTVVPVNQPVLTNAGGTPTYNGLPVRLSVDVAYSLRVDNAQGSQVYYVNGIDPTTDLSLILPSSQVNYQAGNNFAGGVDRTQEAKNSDAISTFDFMTEAEIADVKAGALLVDVTAAVQAAIDYWKTVANRAPLHIIGQLSVTSIQFDTISGGVIHADCNMVAPATGSFDAIVDFVDCSNITLIGKMGINGQYNQNTARGVWVRTDVNNASQFMKLDGLQPTRVKIGYECGRESKPDDLVSENSVANFHSFACPIPIKVSGEQAVLSASGNNSIIAGSDGGDAGWQALPQTNVELAGGLFLMAGGEIQHTTSTTGQAIRSYTIPGGAVGVYGKARLTCVAIETAAPLINTDNVASLVSPTGRDITLIGCGGSNGQDSGSFITTDIDYTGDIVMEKNNFYAQPTRTSQNITALGNANLHIDDKSFGANFKQGLAGISGGIVHFTSRIILSVNDLNAVSIPINESVLKFTAVGTGGDLIRYAGNYAAGTGIFTIPAGGFKFLDISAQFNLAAMTDGELRIYQGGVMIGRQRINQTGQVGLKVKDIVAGDTIEIRIQNDTGGAVVPNANFFDRLEISASNS